MNEIGRGLSRAPPAPLFLIESLIDVKVKVDTYLIINCLKYQMVDQTFFIIQEIL